jgi:hypothetical protein
MSNRVTNYDRSFPEHTNRLWNPDQYAKLRAKTLQGRWTALRDAVAELWHAIIKQLRGLIGGGADG